MSAGRVAYDDRILAQPGRDGERRFGRLRLGRHGVEAGSEAYPLSGGIGLRLREPALGDGPLPPLRHRGERRLAAGRIDLHEFHLVPGAGRHVRDADTHRAGPDHYEPFSHGADSALRQLGTFRRRTGSPESTCAPTVIAAPHPPRGVRMSDTVETRGDDRVELAVGDTNKDGKPDLWVVDTDGDGKPDVFQFDTDGDGEVNITVVDRSQDGTPDEVVDGDGGLPPQT
jgi:hypothetical protein